MLLEKSWALSILSVKQGLPALRAMRGQLKAQQHALLGLQEQLQGTSYPALEAAVADGNTAELTQHPRDYETLPTALSTLLNVVPSEHPALEQPDPSHASMSNPPAGAQQLPRIAPPHGNINLPGQPPHGHHTSQQTIQQSGLGRDLSGAGDASMAGPHGPSQAATEPRQDASGRLQAGAGSEPLRGAAILRKSHEGLAALVSQIGQHVSDTEPEYEARKRPRRTISAEGAKENRHRWSLPSLHEASQSACLQWHQDHGHLLCRAGQAHIRLSQIYIHNSDLSEELCQKLIACSHSPSGPPFAANLEPSWLNFIPTLTQTSMPENKTSDDALFLSYNCI